MLEKTLEAKLRTEVKRAGGLALKFISPGKAGVPDRLVLLPGGRVYFVEMKRPGGKLRPLQRKVIQDFRKLGFKTFVIDSANSIQDFIHILKGGDNDGVPCQTVSTIRNTEDNQHTEDSVVPGHGIR